jgi:hypothetical protein
MDLVILMFVFLSTIFSWKNDEKTENLLDIALDNNTFSIYVH